MDTLTPAAPWVALLLAVVALVCVMLLFLRLRKDERTLVVANNSNADILNALARNVRALKLVVDGKADKRPGRKPTPLADSERLLAGAARDEAEMAAFVADVAARQAAGEGE